MNGPRRAHKSHTTSAVTFTWAVTSDIKRDVSCPTPSSCSCALQGPTFVPRVTRVRPSPPLAPHPPWQLAAPVHPLERGFRCGRQVDVDLDPRPSRGLSEPGSRGPDRSRGHPWLWGTAAPGHQDVSERPPLCPPRCPPPALPRPGGRGPSAPAEPQASACALGVLLPAGRPRRGLSFTACHPCLILIDHQT